MRSLCNYITLPNYKGRKYRKKNQLFWKNFANSKKGSTFAPGKMAEWSNAAVLKTVDLHGSGGSNPSLSATKSSENHCSFFCGIKRGIRSVGGGVAELSASCDIDIVATQLR